MRGNVASHQQWGHRADREPYIVNKERKGSKLKRIELDESVVNERWIQDFLRENPESVPLDPDHAQFGPLVPIGYEVSTPAGRMDNLFIGPQGLLTLVETKLWRNVEARREVVGQVLDYATQLRTWDYQKVDAVTREYNAKYRGRPISLFEGMVIEGRIDADSEASFIDSVTRNLRRGRFLLLIIGDGIREGVESMVELLHSGPQLYFSLGLAEMKLFGLEDGRRLVIPQLVLRTREIERAVVTVDVSDAARKQVNVSIAEPGSPATASTKSTLNGQRRITLDEADFFRQLREASGPEAERICERLIAGFETLGCVAELKQSSLALKLPDTITGGPSFTLLIIRADGLVYTRSLWEQLERARLPKEIGLDFVRNAAMLFKDCVAPADANKPNYWSRTVKLTEIEAKLGDLLDLAKKTVEAINSSEPKPRD